MVGRLLAVLKAKNKSPEPCPEMAPERPIPRPTRRVSRFSWWGSSGASVATTAMMDPPLGVFMSFSQVLANGDTGDGQLAGQAKISLNKNAQRDGGIGKR